MHFEEERDGISRQLRHFSGHGPPHGVFFGSSTGDGGWENDAEFG